MSKITKDEHIRFIKSVIPKALVSVVGDTEILTSNKLSAAEIIITTPFALNTLANYFMDPRFRGDDNLKWIHLTSAGVDRY